MSPQDTTLSGGHPHIFPCSVSTESSRSILTVGSATSTSIRTGYLTNPSLEATRNVTASAYPRTPQHVWRMRLAIAERLMLPIYDAICLRKSSEEEWIWSRPASVYYCVREKDTFVDAICLFVSQSRCLQMIRFLQLCNEQEFPCEAQRQWLRTATRKDFDGKTVPFKQFGRTLTMLVLEAQSFYTRHPDKVPAAQKLGSGTRRRGFYYVETHWKAGDSPRDNFMEHLRRLSNKINEECGSNKHEKITVNESCVCTLRSKISEGSVSVGQIPAKLCDRQETLRQEQLSIHEGYNSVHSTLTREAILDSRPKGGSPATEEGFSRSRTVREDRIRELYQDWKSTSISWASIFSTADAHGFEPRFRNFLKKLLPALPCETRDGQSYVAAQNMDVVLGYFVLVLSEELLTPPLLPKHHPFVLEDLAGTLDRTARELRLSSGLTAKRSTLVGQAGEFDESG